MTASPAEDMRAYDIVYTALGCRPNESLSQAAWRIARLDHMHPAHVVEVARIVLGGGSGRPAHEQWAALRRAAALLDEHAVPPKPYQPT